MVSLVVSPVVSLFLSLSLHLNPCFPHLGKGIPVLEGSGDDITEPGGELDGVEPVCGGEHAGHPWKHLKPNPLQLGDHLATLANHEHHVAMDTMHVELAHEAVAGGHLASRLGPLGDNPSGSGGGATINHVGRRTRSENTGGEHGRNHNRQKG